MYNGWSVAIRNRKLYDGLRKASQMGQRIMTGKDGMIRRLPFPIDGWTKSRDIKPMAARTFMDRWKK